jgi:hypothetical protein
MSRTPLRQSVGATGRPRVAATGTRGILAVSGLGRTDNQTVPIRG